MSESNGVQGPRLAQDGTLEVGVNANCEVVMNLGEIKTGHIVFSVAEARHLMDKLRRKADAAEYLSFLDPKSLGEQIRAINRGLCGHVGADASCSVTTICCLPARHSGKHGGMGAEWSASGGLAERQARKQGKSVKFPG